MSYQNLADKSEDLFFKTIKPFQIINTIIDHISVNKSLWKRYYSLKEATVKS